jgi:hypothetical protein
VSDYFQPVLERAYPVDWIKFPLTSLPGEPAVTALCHCTDCQKWSGGAYTSNVVVPRTAFKVTSSTKPKEYDATGDSGKINKHFFCGTCGSALYTELEVMPEMTCVKAGTLDGGAADFGKVGVEFYTKDRVSFASSCEGAKQEPVFG